MFDIIQVLLSLVNLQAAMLGVAASQAWAYFTPTSGENPFSTTGGGWRARLTPIIAPVIACGATVAMEWDSLIVANDVSRGILSGFASEYMLRVWYKTVRGV